MSDYGLTDEQTARFHADGYVILPRLFDEEEITLLGSIARADQQFAQHVSTRRDLQGGTTRLSLRNDLYDDIYSAIVRSNRVVNPMERLLGGEVYHYHHKMTMKEPYVGGAWEWHQDYGYWYNNGCLYPDMASCYIAVDPATKENGCMQVIKGSHRMGRLDHGKAADQTGADLERVNAALERLELVYAEMEAGDALFFHSNTLHRSDQNRSPNPRWGFICCYNAAANNPYKEGPHPRYHYLEKWEGSKVKEIGRKEWAAMQSAAQPA